jgi:hypothetical protein
VTVSDYPVVAEAYVAKHGKLGALRSWMDTTWHPSTIHIAKSEIHNLILDLDFSIIRTTNYDRWLELAFEACGKPYHKIASMADLGTFKEGERKSSSSTVTLKTTIRSFLPKPAISSE